MSENIHKTDAQIFQTAWENTPENPHPYRHYIVKNLLESSLVQELVSLPFKEYELDYKVGSREEFNPFRQYITPEAISEFDAARRVSDVFLSQNVIESIEAKGSISLKNSLLRIEYAVDKDKFWLGPHTDLGVKLFTMLIYLSEEEDALNWGTDIYVDANTHYTTVPYESNTALSFFPSNNTWHGFIPRKIKGIRKTLIVNYVTQEWRNRQELVHPTQPVY